MNKEFKKEVKSLLKEMKTNCKGTTVIKAMAMITTLMETIEFLEKKSLVVNNVASNFFPHMSHEELNARLRTLVDQLPVKKGR
jgi:hypothetical protein